MYTYIFFLYKVRYRVCDMHACIYIDIYREWLLILTVRDRRRQAPSEQAYRRLKGARVCQLHVRLAEQAILRMLLTSTLSMPLIYNLSEACTLFITLDYTVLLIMYVLVWTNCTNASERRAAAQFQEKA